MHNKKRSPVINRIFQEYNNIKYFVIWVPIYTSQLCLVVIINASSDLIK